MAAPQVGIYTTICLVAIKLILIVLEGFLRRYLSIEVHQRTSDLQNFPIGPYSRCYKQLERVQLKLEALCKLHRRFGNQVIESGLDVETLKSDPGGDQQWTNGRQISNRRRSRTSLNVRELAERISESLQERRDNAASGDLNEMASRLSKVASYIDRDLVPSSDTILLDHEKIRNLRDDIGFLQKCLGSPEEIFVTDQCLLTGIKKRQWRFAWVFRMSGLMMGAVSILLGGFTFVGARDVRLDKEHQCVADADIIGDGVRAGTWSQAAILFLSTMLGSFHHSHTAIKELGSGLLGMHVSLALAFLGPLVQGELSPVDAILGSMILDVQNSALSMQLMEKETLAARWQVGAVMVAQLLGLVTIGIIMHSFTQETLAVDSCKCFSAFWWSWFSNCPTGYPNQVFPFWIYYSLRCLSTAHSWFLSMSKTASYDKALRWEDDNLSRLCRSCRDRNHNDDPTPCECDACTGSPSACKSCGRQSCCSERKMRCEPCADCKQCESCNHMSFEFESTYRKLGFRMHSELPTTVSQLYLEHGAFACLSLVAAERTITMQSVRLTSPVYSIGQITPIVIAGLTILRVVWVTSMELHKQNR